MNQFTVSPPQQINGFVLMGEIGRGAMGSVRMARRISPREEVCVKVIQKAAVATEEDKHFFNNEINVLKTVNHPNIVKFVDMAEDEENYYVFMELCRGIALQKVISDGGKLPDHKIQFIFRQIMSALAYLHDLNIAHRDIKPDNMILTTTDHLKIVDFGLATSGAEELRATFCGSPVFAAPECLMRQEYDAKRSDIWSAGVCLYMMATGKVPWSTMNMTRMMRQIVNCDYKVPTTVSTNVSSLITTMMQIDPIERPTADLLLLDPFLRTHTSCMTPRQRTCSPAIVARPTIDKDRDRVGSRRRLRTARNTSSLPLIRLQVGKSAGVVQSDDESPPPMQVRPPTTARPRRSSARRFQRSASADHFDLSPVAYDAGSILSP